MKAVFCPLMMAAVLATLGLVGCAQPAPLPTPTKAALPASKPVEPTKPPAVQPTAVPAKKTDFPAKGKTITIIVPVPAGGSVDLGARLLAPQMEKELGVPVQVVNKPGAGHQVGLTELALAKPDGYTIGYTTQSAITIYLDPERKAVFTRKSFEPVALTLIEPVGLAVPGTSPYKTTKDLVDAARANAEKVSMGVSGILSNMHITALLLQKVTGVKFALVSFDGAAPVVTALLGGHLEAMTNMQSTMMPLAKSGQIRVLGIADTQESRFLPGARTLEAQGYRISSSSSHGISAPEGTPKEIVEILSGAVSKGLQSEELKAKYAEAGLDPRYMNPAQFAAFWDRVEADIAPLMQLAKP